MPRKKEDENEVGGQTGEFTTDETQFAPPVEESVSPDEPHYVSPDQPQPSQPDEGVETDDSGVPVVVFKACDIFSVGVINLWLEKAQEAGIGSHKIAGMTRVRNEFARWQQENNDKLKRPD